jgi:C-terminal processing protease CtpA/Prc
MRDIRPGVPGESRRRVLEIAATVALLLVVVSLVPGALRLFERQRRMSRVVFSGIGVQLEPVPASDGTIRIAAVMRYAAEDVRNGIRPGDRITHVDGAYVGNRSVEDVVRLIRGPAGTPLSLTLKRSGRREPVRLTVIRRAIRAGQMMDENGEPPDGG